MAKAAIFKFCIFVLIIITIIVFHGIIPTEARQYLMAHREPIKTTPTRVTVGSTSEMRNEEHNVDEFRPTTPGNSPGIGHSIHT
ncbi:unnamed protein product [Cochlearia groenlandica]